MSAIHTITRNGTAYREILLRWKPGQFADQEAVIDNVGGSITRITDFVMQSIYQQTLADTIVEKMRLAFADGRLALVPSDAIHESVDSEIEEFLEGF